MQVDDLSPVLKFLVLQLLPLVLVLTLAAPLVLDVGNQPVTFFGRVRGELHAVLEFLFDFVHALLVDLLQAGLAVSCVLFGKPFNFFVTDWLFQATQLFKLLFLVG